jgi:hypothetical protein
MSFKDMWATTDTILPQWYLLDPKWSAEGRIQSLIPDVKTGEV